MELEEKQRVCERHNAVTDGDIADIPSFYHGYTDRYLECIWAKWSEQDDWKCYAVRRRANGETG